MKDIKALHDRINLLNESILFADKEIDRCATELEKIEVLPDTDYIMAKREKFVNCVTLMFKRVRMDKEELRKIEKSLG
tara:strand:- start:4676 stop:4909 length:234 start_codon:yes stop_codon:yes gene_type:complete